MAGKIRENQEKTTAPIAGISYSFIIRYNRASRKTEQGYLRLLNQAKMIKYILDIQNQLQDLRSDIEAIEGRLRYLQNSVNFSTLHISMYQQIEDTSATGSLKLNN